MYVHTENMANGAVGEGAVAGDSILFWNLSPSLFSTAWIYAEVPVLLP